MANIVSKKFNIHIAQQFKEAFDESDPSQLYLFYSKVTPWNDESSPADVYDTIKYTDYDIWRGMLSLKKISNNSVTMSVAKTPWTSNTVYTMYKDTDPNLATSNFVVFTGNNVYKCVYNNNGARSTSPPTGQNTTSIITTSDGYKWKFMYNVTAADYAKYGGLNHIPVKTLTSDDSSLQWSVQQNAANGAVQIFDVTAGGSGYLENKGTVAGVTSTSVVTISSDASNVDSSYANSSFYISGGQGLGQTRVITGYNAVTKQVTLASSLLVSPNTSSTYHIGPTININGDGSGATAYANVSGGVITKITPINVGQNYSYVRPTITSNPSYGSGATTRVYLPPFGGHGSDPERELFATNVTLNVIVDGGENGFFAANNQFRVYGILKDPVTKSGSAATGDRYNQALRLNVNSASGEFSQDEFVIGDTSGAKGRVIYFANTNSARTSGVLHLTYVTGVFSNTEPLTANTSAVTASIAGITSPDLQPYTGSMLYAVTRTPIEKDADQKENFTITVKF
jgi:hypothetical protein